MENHRPVSVASREFFLWVLAILNFLSISINNLSAIAKACICALCSEKLIVNYLGFSLYSIERVIQLKTSELK